jgi:hypothetical protein
MAFGKKDCPRAKVYRKCNHARNQKEEQADGIQNNDNRIKITAIFLVDAVGIENGSAGGKQRGGGGSSGKHGTPPY